VRERRVTDRVQAARARLDAIAARERACPEIHPEHGTRWWIGDEVAPTAVVLLHGLTNGPPQLDVLGPQLHARGHAVIVPRMPYHGYRNRMTGAFAKLRAEDLEAAALEAVALAALAGDRVVVGGISVGATLAGWIGARTRIDTGIAIAPFCGVRELPDGLNDALGALMRTAPNAFFWWDPRNRERQPPPHGYPRFSTRALGESLRISSEMERAPAGPHARRVVTVLNHDDPVVNNAHARRRFNALRPLGIDVEHVVLTGLPKIHDIVEPAIPQARTELIYPQLIEIVEAT
jgi:dienelactone hydrolase